MIESEKEAVFAEVAQPFVAQLKSNSPSPRERQKQIPINNNSRADCKTRTSWGFF